MSVEVGFVTMAIGSFLHPQTGMDRQAQRCRAGSEGDEWLSEEHIKTESNTDGFGPPGLGPAHR